jgi:hypothetical protein
LPALYSPLQANICADCCTFTRLTTATEYYWSTLNAMHRPASPLDRIDKLASPRLFDIVTTASKYDILSLVCQDGLAVQRQVTSLSTLVDIPAKYFLLHVSSVRIHHSAAPTLPNPNPELLTLTPTLTPNPLSLTQLLTLILTPNPNLP